MPVLVGPGNGGYFGSQVNYFDNYLNGFQVGRAENVLTISH
jgi:hypothetical protein